MRLNQRRMLGDLLRTRQAGIAAYQCIVSGFVQEELAWFERIWCALLPFYDYVDHLEITSINVQKHRAALDRLKAERAALPF